MDDEMMNDETIDLTSDVDDDIIDVDEENDDMMEYRDQVRETLEDVLPSRKMVNVTDSQILSVLEKYSKWENMEIDID